MKTFQLTFPSLSRSFFACLLLGSFALGFSGCSKDDDDDDNNNTAPTASNIPPLNDADGVLVAVETKTTVSQFGFTYEQLFGTGVAAFYNSPGATTFVDAGTVSVDDSILQKQTNNSYVWTPQSATNIEGIDFGYPVNWEVTGAGSIPSITKSVTTGFPDLDTITSATNNISSNSSYTLSVADVSNADSVIFQIATAQGNKLVTRPGNTTSYTFSASDMQALGSGSGIIQVAAYNFTWDTYSGKKIYFINEQVVTKTVNIQ
ncbi:MAG: hypothetical protein SFW35_01300 [Chitinophagales bacterium]|nr:hypothetical protein [Chitinophagales bacterium]